MRSLKKEAKYRKINVKKTYFLYKRRIGEKLTPTKSMRRKYFLSIFRKTGIFYLLRKCFFSSKKTIFDVWFLSRKWKYYCFIIFFKVYFWCPPLTEQNHKNIKIQLKTFQKVRNKKQNLSAIFNRKFQTYSWYLCFLSKNPQWQHLSTPDTTFPGCVDTANSRRSCRSKRNEVYSEHWILSKCKKMF